MTFLDTNILFDVLYNDAAWRDWSLDAVLAAGASRFIAPVVYSELAGRYQERGVLDSELSLLGVRIEEPSRNALFQAGRAHALYRSRGGTRARVLPDFLIGAQAADRRAALVTRAAGRYRTAFPHLELISPDLA